MPNPAVRYKTSFKKKFSKVIKGASCRSLFSAWKKIFFFQSGLFTSIWGKKESVCIF